MSNSSLTPRILVGLVGGFGVAVLAEVVDRIARGHWLSLSHAIIVGVVAAVISAMIPWRSVLRRR